MKNRDIIMEKYWPSTEDGGVIKNEQQLQRAMYECQIEMINSYRKGMDFFTRRRADNTIDFLTGKLR